MSVDVVGLRALAEKAAVEGPWTIWHDLDHQGFKTVGDAKSYRQMLADGHAEDCNPVAHVYTDADAEFIAAANPSVMLALLDEITTLRAENERLSQTRQRWQDAINAAGFEAAVEAEASAYHDNACLYLRRAETAEAALTARDRGMCKARFSDEDPVECWLLAGHDGDHIVDGGAYIWAGTETRLREAEADRDARIEAARKHIGFPGQACGPLDVRRAQEALSVPAVPVPQDNPESIRVVKIAGQPTAADSGMVPEAHLRGRWSNGDPVHIVTDGVDRWVAPNRNGATWMLEES